MLHLRSVGVVRYHVREREVVLRRQLVPAGRFGRPAGAKFCLECGAPFGLRCSNCQTELPVNAKFCLECGTSVARGDSEQPQERDPRSYTPKHLADKIFQSKSALEGDRKQVTVLFADVQGSMELQEQMDPEEWYRIMEPLLESESPS